MSATQVSSSRIHAGLERAEIAALIPHTGSMCLLDKVIDWDETRIACRSNGHLRDDNPLAECGRLDAAHGLEYGAQAAAIHGALLARLHGTGNPPAARVAAYRRVSLERQRLDVAGTALDIEARRLAAASSVARGGDAAEVYSVQVTADGALLVSGRVTIAFMRAAAATAPRPGAGPD